MRRGYPKPRYRVGQPIVGRTDHVGDHFPNEVVMIVIDSARWHSDYGHWIYCGRIMHEGEFGEIIEIREYDVIYKLKNKRY